VGPEYLAWHFLPIRHQAVYAQWAEKVALRRLVVVCEHSQYLIGRPHVGGKAGHSFYIGLVGVGFV
jgi:hypothetical protein